MDLRGYVNQGVAKGKLSAQGSRIRMFEDLGSTLENKAAFDTEMLKKKSEITSKALDTISSLYDIGSTAIGEWRHKKDVDKFAKSQGYEMDEYLGGYIKGQGKSGSLINFEQMEAMKEYSISDPSYDLDAALALQHHKDAYETEALDFKSRQEEWKDMNPFKQLLIGGIGGWRTNVDEPSWGDGPPNYGF